MHLQPDQDTTALQPATVLPQPTGRVVHQPIAGPAAVHHPLTAVRVIRPVRRPITAQEATDQAAIRVALHPIPQEAGAAAAAVHIVEEADPAEEAAIQEVLHQAQAVIQAAAVQVEEGNRS